MYQMIYLAHWQMFLLWQKYLCPSSPLYNQSLLLGYPPPLWASRFHLARTVNKYIYSKWSVRCSFCGKKGHNIRSCTQVPAAARDHDYKVWDAFRVAMAQGEMDRRKELAERTPSKRKKPHCGFCGARKHNRKNCPKLKKTKKLIYSANMRWRRRFVERINALGLGDGALIEVKGIPVDALLTGRGVPIRTPIAMKHIGIVEPFDHESLNVFCNFTGHWDYRSKADVRAKVTTDKGFVSINLGKYVGEDLFYKNAFYSQYNSVKVVSRSKSRLSSDWIEEKNLAPIDWLLKTHSLEELKDFHIMTFIEKWT